MPARNKKTLLLLLLAASLLVCGAARVAIFLQGEATRDLAPYAGKDRVVEGRVINDPERRETSLHVYLKVAAVNGKEAQGGMLVMLPREARVAFGDQLKVAGDIALPESFETDTGRLFDYPGYLRVRGVSALMRFAVLEEREEAGFSLRGTLFSMKHTFEHSLRKLLPEPDASLMEGMLLGERRGIPEDLNNALIVVGLIHIVVLSGYNISIVAEQVLRFFSLFLSRLGKQFQTGFVGEQHQGHFATLPIILALDVWEHAYLLDHGALGKAVYIDAFFKNLNWAVIEKRFESVAK